jgi:hypothetical protein
VAALWAVVILMYPANVQSMSYEQTDAGIVGTPCTLHTMTWAALLWDYCGCDLLYTYEDGLALPGNWPFAGAYKIYDGLGIPVY